MIQLRLYYCAIILVIVWCFCSINVIEEVVAQGPNWIVYDWFPGDGWYGISGSPAVVAGTLVNTPAYTVYVFHRSSGGTGQIYMINSSDESLASSSWSGDQSLPAAFEAAQDSMSAFIDGTGILWLSWTSAISLPTQPQVVYATFDGITWSPPGIPGFNLTQIESPSATATFCLLPASPSTTVLTLIYPAPSATSLYTLYWSNWTGNGWSEPTEAVIYLTNSPTTLNPAYAQVSCVTQGVSTMLAYTYSSTYSCTSPTNLQGFWAAAWTPDTAFYGPVSNSNSYGACLRPAVAFFDYAVHLHANFMFFAGGTTLYYNYETAPNGWQLNPLRVLWGTSPVTMLNSGVSTVILGNGNLAVFFTSLASAQPTVTYLIAEFPQ